MQVLGHAAAPLDFLYGGYTIAEGLRDALQFVGRPLDAFRNVLDFGCGCGRVLRWFQQEARVAGFSGADVSAGAIAWDREFMPFGRFSVNNPSPPLPYPDKAFDLVYGVSVVTHLDEELHLAWLEELNRVLEPGGILMLTVMGDEIAPTKLNPGELARFRQDGHFYRHVRKGGLHGLPDFYQDAYHSRDYVERVWGKKLGLLAHIRNGPMYLQDLVILEKGRKTECPLWLDLPLGVISWPEIGCRVGGPVLEVSGWSFHVHGGACVLDIALDGRRVGSCLARNPRADVGAVFPAWPGAQTAGYSVTVPLDGLAPGLHALKISARTNLLPCMSTYFLLD